MHEGGVIKRLENKRKPIRSAFKNVATNQSLDIIDVMMPFIALGLFAVISFIILLFEILVSRMSKKGF